MVLDSASFSCQSKMRQSRAERFCGKEGPETCWNFYWRYWVYHPCERSSLFRTFLWQDRVLHALCGHIKAHTEIIGVLGNVYNNKYVTTSTRVHPGVLTVARLQTALLWSGKKRIESAASMIDYGPINNRKDFFQKPWPVPNCVQYAISCSVPWES